MVKCTHNTISASLEDYVMTIYTTIQEKKGVKAIDISKKLGVGRSSVTDALKHLSEKELINYNPYDVISLTEKGESIAIEITNRHKVLHDFFENVLVLPPDEAAKNACGMSHAITQEAFNKFTQFISTAGKK